MERRNRSDKNTGDMLPVCSSRLYIVPLWFTKCSTFFYLLPPYNMSDRRMAGLSAVSFLDQSITISEVILMNRF